MRIVLTGTYNSSNKGDAAMQLGALEQIRARYPDCRATVLSPFPELDAPFYAPVPVARCNRRNLVLATLDLARGLLWRSLGSNGPGWLLSVPMRLVRDCDLVVDLSGDMLTDDYGPHVAYSHYIPLLRALVVGRPYVLCAQSIGPFATTRALARLVLRRAAEVTVRDAISLANVSALAPGRARLSRTADMAFLMSPAAREHALETLKAEGFTADGRPVLGISVSRLVERKYRQNRRGRAPGFVELMKRVIERVTQEHGARVIFVPHVTGPSRAKDDRLIAAQVAATLDSTVTATVLTGDYRPEVLKAIIGCCTVFCGARMHANIAALSSCVPTVAVAYSHKSPGIMAEFGMEDLLVHADSMTERSLGDLVSRVFTDRDAVASRLARRIGEVRESASRNLAGLRELADCRGGAR